MRSNRLNDVAVSLHLRLLRKLSYVPAFPLCRKKFSWAVQVSEILRSFYEDSLEIVDIFTSRFGVIRLEFPDSLRVEAPGTCETISVSPAEHPGIKGIRKSFRSTR